MNEEAQMKELVNEVMKKALTSFEAYSAVSKKRRAAFLNEIAEQIELQRSSLVPSAMEESHLPETRLQGELTRTVNQLKMFASLVEEGSWVEAVIDKSNPERKPAPKPDTRKMLQPVGPVVVFGASNFPFAFSTAGGDTASALAAGASVVIKVHPGHPNTSRLVYECMKKAEDNTGMPEYTVQHLNESSFIAGKALVQHSVTAGIGFTGSFAGGRALMDYAALRDKPIPVFAEMSSINPVVLYPEYLEMQANEIAKKLSASITLGMGQFCTNPGLLLIMKGPGLEEFIWSLSHEIELSLPQPMLHKGIAQNYTNAIGKIKSTGDVQILTDTGKNYSGKKEVPVIAKVDAAVFLEKDYLKDEVFGPYSLLVICKDKEELKQVLQSLPGQLTTTIMATENDMAHYREICKIQHRLAGRILVNDVPTGVEVCSSMVHGGPYPATSDERFTSVGTTAIKRWVRPVCYQGFPQQFLPDELKDENPLQIWRLIDNEWIK